MDFSQCNTPKLKPNFNSRRLSGAKVSAAFRSPVLDPSASKRPRLQSPTNEKAPVSFISPLSSKVLNAFNVLETTQCDANLPSCMKDTQESTEVAQCPLVKHEIFNIKSSAQAKITDDTTPEILEQDIAELQQELNEIEAEMSTLKQCGCKVEDLQWYIKKFHEYNDIKDIAQSLMGRIAVLEETTVKEVHEQFGLSADD